MKKLLLLWAITLLSSCSGMGMSGMRSQGNAATSDQSNVPYSMRHDLKPGDPYYGG
jgi:hypothetical protein